MNGYVYLGYTAIDEETGDVVERVEALPCRRCAEYASWSGRRIDTCTARMMRSGSWRARLVGIADTPMDAKNAASGSRPMRIAPTARGAASRTTRALVKQILTSA
jgi:hypothetical protein